MVSQEYWRKRSEELAEALERNAADAYKSIVRDFIEAEKEIESNLALWYAKIAENNTISIADAKKLLDADELVEFHWDVEEYIKYGKENAINGAWMKELENASAKVHISKFEAQKVNLRQSIEKLYNREERKVEEVIKKSYTEGYYRTAYDIQKGIGVGFEVAEIDDNLLKKITSKPWAADGRNFSDRIWINKTRLVDELDKQITRNVMLGKSPQGSIAAIAKEMKTSRYRAGALVMTESAYFGSKAREDSFKELGVEEYEVVATLDADTSEICQEMDGKVFPMKEFSAGTTAPPFHVNCRSTTAPYFKDMEGIGQRAARDAVTGESFTVPSDMTYNEWKRMQDEKYGEGTVDEVHKMNANERADSEQYERYKKRLGDAAPATVDEFIKLKEKNTQEWTDLQRTYRYKGIDNRLLARNPSYKVMDINEGVPDSYKKQEAALSKRSKEVVYKYTDGGAGCDEINTYAGSGNVISPTAVQNCADLHDTLADMYMPENTVVFRGTMRSRIDGLDQLEGNLPISEWKKRTIGTKAFSSTSLFRDTAYDSEVEMTILLPKGQEGVGYVNDISYNFLNKNRSEYEVILQNESKYAIVEAQYFNKKLFLVVRRLGG